VVASVLGQGIIRGFSTGNWGDSEVVGGSLIVCCIGSSKFVRGFPLLWG
jgi:hypothetical protein